VVGDEPHGADEHIVDTLRVQVGEVVEDVGAEPRLARRRLALEGERPLADRCAIRDET
jgi:hypothetical protein